MAKFYARYKTGSNITHKKRKRCKYFKKEDCSCILYKKTCSDHVNCQSYEIKDYLEEAKSSLANKYNTVSNSNNGSRKCPKCGGNIAFDNMMYLMSSKEKEPAFKCQNCRSSYFSNSILLVGSEIKINGCVYTNIKNLKPTSEEKRRNLYNSKDTYKTPDSLNERIINYKDFLVKGHTRHCIYQEHKIEDINAIVDILDTHGIKRKVTIPAGFCAKCNCYYMLESSYVDLKKKGLILCRVIDKKTYRDSTNNNGKWNLSAESLLKQYGYSVSSSENLSDSRRYLLLQLIIDNGILTKSEIIEHLEFCINMHKDTKYKRAKEKWLHDIEMVRSYYKHGTTNVNVGSIYRI